MAKKTIKDYRQEIRKLKDELREAKERSVAHWSRIEAHGYNRGRRYVTDEFRALLGIDQL